MSGWQILIVLVALLLIAVAGPPNVGLAAARRPSKAGARSIGILLHQRSNPDKR